MSDYGGRIKLARERLNMTQEELGKKIGVTGVTIMRYEKNQREPRLDTLAELSNALNVSLSYLLGNEDIEGFLLPDAFADPGDYEFIKALGLHDPTIRNQSYNQVDDLELRLKNAFHRLNEEGQKKAVERIEELAELRRYWRTAY